MTKFFLLAILLFITFSCSTHHRANIKANEKFIVELKKSSTRGGAIETALQGLLFGVNYLAEKSAKSLNSSYSQSISINDYYNTDLGKVEKTYEKIYIKKYSKPDNKEQKTIITQIVRDEFKGNIKSRGEESALTLNEVIRDKEDDILNFQAVIELISDPENPGITKLSFNELRILFSKTKVFKDEDLNAKVSLLIEGQWRDSEGTPHKKTLIEQVYDFKKLKYGYENQIKTPIVSPWYYDIPIYSDIEGAIKYGLINITIQLEEYEGNKSRYINKLPNILDKNKKVIINQGASSFNEILK
ncbi:hypothetical protein L3X39_14655 [Sabulilitoribacter multivorans]|uniref:Lipoprotein n=1 Tax=Flaviramulus multivorans TaxID=1304750 RepID=A0ABS9IMQ7_9FLAO|nr:hypothetical protein [Flaviramulus multivorans]MCF7561883.1 hypothetical protein [Flaviramulus multivorans]